MVFLSLTLISCDLAKKDKGSSSSSGSSSGGGGSSPATVPSAPRLDHVQCLYENGSWKLGGAWDDVSGATSYNIYYVTAYQSSPDVIKNTGTKIAGVSSSDYYTFNPSYHSNSYVITAVNSAGESAASNVVDATCGG